MLNASDYFMHLSLERIGLELQQKKEQSLKCVPDTSVLFSRFVTTSRKLLVKSGQSRFQTGLHATRPSGVFGSTVCTALSAMIGNDYVVHRHQSLVLTAPCMY